MLGGTVAEAHPSVVLVSLLEFPPVRKAICMWSIAAALLVSPQLSQAKDWTNWRGPNNNGVSAETELPEKIKASEPGKDNFLWSAPHGCRSTPLVHNGRVFFNSHTGERRDIEQESVVCLDANTGAKLWQYKFNVFHTDIVSNRVGWTTMAIDSATGNVYCHGTQGTLLCLSRDGKLVWERSLSEEFGRVSGYGGRLSGVTLDGDLVIVPINCAVWGKYGRGGSRLVAFHKSTGQTVWYGSTGYRVLDSFQSTPVVSEVNGQRLVFSGGGDGGLHAFKVNTGEKVWSHIFCLGAVNTSPVCDGNLVYIAHGDVSPEEGNLQGRVLCIDASQVTEGKPKVVWQKDGMKIKFASPILDKGRLILNDEDGKLYCLDAKTGEEIWALGIGGGGNVRCSPVLADGKFYVGDSRGRFYVVKDDPVKPKKLAQVLLYSIDAASGERIDGEIDGSCSVSDGRVYIGNGTTLYCFGSATAKKAATSPAAVVKSPSKEKPAFLQVFPGEVTLTPGSSATFKARLYDAKGNFIKETPATWELGSQESPEKTVGLPDPPVVNAPALKGTLTPDGKLTVPADVQGQFGRVVAKAEGLEGSAGVRQVPKLPYSQDFEKVPDNAVPGGWVNSVVKFQVRTVDGNKVLVKTATNPNPLAARANAFISGPELSEYTIQCDMLAKRVKDQIGDMGVVANRYSLFLQGDLQQFRLVSWGGLLRIDKTISYPWTDNVWYTLKLKVSKQGNDALVQGKIWEKDKPEPAAWTVEVVDKAPNFNGAAAIYARVPPGSIEVGEKPADTKVGSEMFFDNLKITPNK